MNSEEEKNLENKNQKLLEIEPGYISLAGATGISPYSQEYLSLLCRQGKLKAKKFGRNWYITKEAINDYLKNQGIKIILPKHFFDISYKGRISKPCDFLSISEQREPKTIFAALGEMPPEEEPTEGEEKKEFPKQTIRTMRKDVAEIEGEEKIFERLLTALESRLPPHRGVGGKIGEFEQEAARHFRSPVRAMLISVAALIIFLLLVGGVSFGNFDKAMLAVHNFFKNAETLQGHQPGTHANEVLLINKEGNISIYGHIETQGQLRSWVKEGVAPIVVDSTTMVENLNVEMLGGMKNEDFTLAFVTKNGNITYEDVKLEGKVEVGKELVVKGATKLLDSLFVYGNLGTFGDIVGKGNLEIAGSAKIGKELLALGGIKTQGANLDLGAGTIILSNQNLIKNLNAEFLDSKRAKDFTLDFVTSQGNTTSNTINIGGLNVSGQSEFQGMTFHRAGLWAYDGSFYRSLGVGGDFSANGSVSLGSTGKTVSVTSSGWSVSKEGDILAKTLSVPAVLGNTTFSGDVTLASPANLTLNAGSITVSQLSAPTNPSATATTEGTLTAGTYYYKITALNNNGETTASSEVSATVDGTTTNAIKISWDKITGASSYRIYRGTTSGGQNVYFEDSDDPPFLDTGEAGTTGTVPTENTTGGSGTFSGLTILGSTISRSILPETASFYNLGSPTFPWATIYGDTLNVTTVATTGDFTVGGNLQVNGNTTLGNEATDITTIRGLITLSDSSLAYPLRFGADVDLYRSAANTLYTPDSFGVGGSATIAGGLTVSAGGASITGGIDNNLGGITEAGAISGATQLIVDNLTLDGATITSDTGAISFDNENLTTTGQIQATTFTDGTLSITGGNITGGGTAVFSIKVTTAEIENTGNITLDAINATADSTIYVLNSDAIYKANLNIEGDIIIGGTISGGATTITSLDVSSGGITNAGAISGATTISMAGTLTNTGIGAGITFSGTGDHLIQATDGTLKVGAATLTGTITGNSQDITGLNALGAATGTFSTSVTSPLFRNDGNLTIDAVSTSPTNTTITLTNSGTGSLTALNIAEGDLQLGGTTRISSAGAGTLTNLTLTNTSNQLVLTGTGGITGTLTWTPATANKTITLPDATGTVALGTGTTNYAAYWSATNTIAGEQYLAVSRGGTGAGTLNDLITLGTHTTGNYVATAAGTSPIQVSGSGTETAAITISCPTCVTSSGGGGDLFTLAGSSGTPQTISTGDTLLVEAGTNITTTAGATDKVTVATIANPTFSTSVTSPLYTGTGAVTLSSGGTSALTLDSASGLIVLNDNLYFEKGTYDTTLAVTTPTAARTITLPDASGTVALGTGTANYAAYWSATNTLAGEQYLAVSRGGTGAGTFTQYGVLYGNATSAIGVTAAGSTGQVLIATTGAAPSWGTVGGGGVTPDSLDFTEFKDTMTLDANLILNQSTYTWTQNFDGTTTTGLTYNANSLTTGTAISIASSSTAGEASGSSYLLNLSRSGANTNAIHTAYGLYATVTNTGTTSTNVAAYLSASGATNNYGLLVASGNVGIGTATPGYKLEVAGGNSYFQDTIYLGTTSTYFDSAGALVMGGQNITSLGTNITATAALTIGTGANNDLTLTTGTGTITLTASNIILGAQADSTLEAVRADRSLTLTQESGGNVTITNSGTALDLTANRSWTLGWTGLLSIARGGTNASATPTAGAVAYGTGSAYAFSLAGTSGYALISGGTGAPTWTNTPSWSTITLSTSVTSPLYTGTGAVTLSSGGTSALTLDSASGLIVLNDNLFFEKGTYDTTLAVTTPTAARTITLPDATGTVAVSATAPITLSSAGAIGLTTPLAISYGGTAGTATPTAGAIAYGTGSAYAFTLAGSTGQPLLSGAAGSPTWGTLSVSYGGTGLTSLASGSLIYGSGTSPVNTLAIGTANYVLTSSGTAPQWSLIGQSNISPDSLDFTEFKDAMTLDANLTISASASNYSINIDSGTLFVDTANDRVGIGTTAPGAKLDVAGLMLVGPTQSKFLSGISVFSNGNKASTTYRKLFILPVSSGSSYDQLVLSGQVGGWTASQGKASIWLSLAVRDAERFVGTYIGDLGNQDILIYKEADNTYSVWGKTISYTTSWSLTATGNFIEGSSTSASVPVYVGNYTSETTTAPTGTLVYSLASNAQQVLSSSGNVGIGDTSPAALLTVGNGDLFQVISTGEVRTIAGAVGAPSYSFTGDTNTGMYSGGADNLKLVTGGTDRVTIDSSGQVTIPIGVQTLWVKGYSDGLTIYPALYTSDPGFLVYTGTGSAWSERMRISGNAATANVSFSNSNVGIGDTSPAALLTVGSGDLFQVNASGAIAAVVGITNTGGYTQSGSSANTFTGTTTFSGAIDSNGDLSVADTNIAFDGASTTFTTTGAFTLTPGGAVTLGDGGDTMYINSSDWDISTAGAMTGISGISNDGSYTQSGTSANTFTGTATFSNATYSALFTGGNVGIGTTSPSELLHVNGNVRIGNWVAKYLSATELGFYDSGNNQVFVLDEGASPVIWEQTLSSQFEQGSFEYTTTSDDRVYLAKDAGGNYYSHGTFTSSIYDYSGIGDFIQLRTTTKLPASTKITAQVQVSDDNFSTIKDSITLELVNDTYTYDISSLANAKSVRVKFDFQTENTSLSPELISFEVWADLIKNSSIAEDGSLATTTPSVDGLEPTPGVGEFIQKVKDALASLGLFIENGVAHVKEILTEKLISNTIITNQLCLGNTCINEAQLKELLAKNGSQGSADTTPPETTIDSHPENPSSSTEADFTFSSSEENSTFQCNLNSQGWEDCVSPKQYLSLADGNYQFEVKATDAAGNTDETPATFSWAVNTASSGGSEGSTGGVCEEGTTQQCGTTDVGACQFGTQTCSGGVWGNCAGSVEPTTETCNNIDDDCNGAVDEDNICGEITSPLDIPPTDNTSPPIDGL